MNRQQFLEDRQKGIGSSDVAPILGLSKWSTAIDVYLSKVQPWTDQGKMEPQLEWGLRKEPAIAAAIVDHYGWRLDRVESVFRHPKYEFLAANPDRLVVAKSGVMMPKVRECCEIKTAAYPSDWGEIDTAEIPQDYWLQAQHQLEVCDLDVCWVFVLIGACDFRRYRVERDPGYLELVLEPLQEFWGKVQAKTPPDPDWAHPKTLDSIKALYKPQPGKTVELDASAQNLVEHYESVSKEIKELERIKDESKAKLIEAMGGAELGILPSGQKITYRTVSRAGYTVEPTTYADFRIKKGSR